MTDESTTNNVNNVMCDDHKLLVIFLLTLPERQIIFLYKAKIYNGKMNKSYDIMYGERF